MPGERPDERFPKLLRLRSRAEFLRVQGSRQKHTTRSLVVVHLANTLTHPRLGLTVSRKVGNAVVRNRVKRWLREAFRRERWRAAGVDLVVIARPSAAGRGYEALRAELIGALEAVGRPG